MPGSFLNPSFEETDNGTEPTGWTIVNQRVKSGEQITLDGELFTAPLDTTYPANLVNTRSSNGTGFNLNQNTAFDDAPLNAAGTLTSYLVGAWGNGATLLQGGASDGDNALRLISTGVNLDAGYGYGVVRGPWIYSSEFSVLAGQNFTFDWQAVGGNDAYDVFGFLINTGDGTSQIVLDDTGATGNATTGGWVSEEVLFSTSGSYRFVFFSGSFDATGGRALGASLYLDNFAGSAVEMGAGPATGELALDQVLGFDVAATAENGDGSAYAFIAETATIDQSVVEAADTTNLSAGQSSLTIAPINKEFTFSGGDSNDTIIGGAFRDEINSGRGDDTIFTGYGDDVIDAGDGNDRIDAGSGADVIDAGNGDDDIVVTGADVITGGAGADSFVLSVGVASFSEMATIVDFSATAGDKIVIEQAGTLSVASSNSQSAGDFGSSMGYNSAKALASLSGSTITIVQSADGLGSYVFVDENLDGVFESALALTGVSASALNGSAFEFS